MDTSSEYNKQFNATPGYYSLTPGLTAQEQLAKRAKFFKDNMLKPCTDSVALIQNSATKSPVLNTLASEFIKMAMPTKDFASKAAFEDYVTARNYGINSDPVFCFGIQVDKDDTSHFEY